MRGREFIDQCAAFAVGQFRFQIGGQRVDGFFASLKSAPVFVELCGVLAAQQGVFPLLHLELERDERGGHHALIGDVVLHGDAVRVDRLIEGEDAVQRAREHQQQGDGEGERDFNAEFH